MCFVEGEPMETVVDRRNEDGSCCKGIMKHKM